MVDSQSTLLQKLKPKADKKWLLFFAGLVWMGVGIKLSGMAFQWLWEYSGDLAFLFLIFGIIIFIIKYSLVFVKFDKKNILRIENLPDKPCAFSFLSWQGYVLIGLMMGLGISLRHSNLPKEYLSILYLGIGLSLLVASFRYFKTFIDCQKEA